MSQRDRSLVPCPACNRHVTTDEARCPFCAAPVPVGRSELPRAPARGRLGRAALFVAAGASATLINACSNSVAPPYGASPGWDAGSMSDAVDGAPDTGGGGGAGGARIDGADGASAGAGGTGPGN